MGVSVNYTIRNATIEQVYWAEAVGAVNALFEDGCSYDWLSSGKRNHTSLTEAIKEWGFHVEESPTCIEIRRFEWSSAGDEDCLLNALAPYLNPDSVFEYCYTDELDHWRYVIKSGQLIRQRGKVVYEE